MRMTEGGWGIENRRYFALHHTKMPLSWIEQDWLKYILTKMLSKWIVLVACRPLTPRGNCHSYSCSRRKERGEIAPMDSSNQINIIKVYCRPVFKIYRTKELEILRRMKKKKCFLLVMTEKLLGLGQWNPFIFTIPNSKTGAPQQQGKQVKSCHDRLLKVMILGQRWIQRGDTRKQFHHEASGWWLIVMGAELNGSWEVSLSGREGLLGDTPLGPRSLALPCSFSILVNTRQAVPP